MASITDILSNPFVLLAWAIAAFISLIVLLYDLSAKNRHIVSSMKLVWILTVLYAGPIGLAIYYYAGRVQIKKDTMWTRGFRSVSHCFSGCGTGEIVGIVILAGILALQNNWIIAIGTFTLAYVFGYATTMFPLLQEGLGFWQSFKDAFYSDTITIAAMEIVAIGVDLWLGGMATITETLFWSAMIVSLIAGLLAAYPLNVLAVYLGMKKGMHSPKMHHHA